MKNSEPLFQVDVFCVEAHSNCEDIPRHWVYRLVLEPVLVGAKPFELAVDEKQFELARDALRRGTPLVLTLTEKEPAPRFEEEKPPTPRTCGYEKDPTETEE